MCFSPGVLLRSLFLCSLARCSVTSAVCNMPLALVKTTRHAARGNNAQARGILQTADVTEQRANEHKNKLCNKAHGEKHTVRNKWTTPLVTWNRISPNQ
jgi:hypothetical protein